MNNSDTLSLKSFDTSCIVTNLLIYRLFTRIPSIFPKTAGSAAALSTVYSGIIVLVAVWLLTSILCKTPRLNIIDTADKLMGKFGKFLVSIFVLFYLAVSSTVILGEFSEFAKLISFPTAPVAFCALFFVVAAVFGALSGIGAVSRLHRLFVPAIFVVLLIVVISTLWDGDLSNIFPVLGKGAQNVFGKGISGIVMYSDIILVFLISSREKPLKEAKRNIICSSVIGILTVCAVVFVFNVRIPYPISAEGQFPIYLLLKEIHYGRFFQRIDAILLFVATLSGMLHLSLNLRLFTDIAGQAFKVSDTKPLIFTFALTLFSAVAGVQLFPSQTLKFLLFGSCFFVFAVFIAVVLFAKARGKLKNENS